MKTPPRLIFSERHHIDEAFQSYCKLNGLQYCILNFLSWLRTTKLGQETIRRLKE